MRILNTERIEVPTIEAHSASVLYHQDQRILTWFGGYQEGIGCCIYGKVDDHDIIKIAKPESAIGNHSNSLWNPVIFEAGGELLLFYKEGRFCDCWQTIFAKCAVNNNELKITGHINLPAGIHASVKTKPYVDGDLLICGSSAETRQDWASYTEVFKYNQGALTLVGKSHPIKNKQGSTKIKGIIQPAIWKEEDTYHMLMRSSSDSSFIYHSQSSRPNNPVSWSEAAPTNINNPNSSVDVLQHSNGRLYLICNPSATFRDPLSVMQVRINDKHSIMTLDILDQVDIELENDWLTYYPNARTKELSYPYVIETPDGNIEIAYTFCRKEIRVTTVQV